MPSLKEITQFIEENWFKKSGLITVEIVALIVTSTFLVKADAGFPWWSLLIGIGLIIWFVWFFTTKPPVVPENKIGFLVCITCSDKEELRDITDDFIIPLRKLVKSGKTGDPFHFVDMPQHLTREVIDAESALRMRVRCKAHFMIYGRVRRKVINKEENHIFELEGVVAHQPISKQVSDSLAIEFTELLPRNVQISKENDLFSFQFTSEWTEIVARYVIGIATAYSGDIDYAEDLYLEVLSKLQSKDQNFPIYRKLKERVPHRLAELYEAEASSCFSKWSQTRNPDYLTEINEWLDKIDEVLKNQKSVLFFRAITSFLMNRSVNEAISMLKRVKENDNQIWQYNMAFLNAYKGDLKKAIQHYRQADRCDHQHEKLFQIEDFIDWIIKQEPTKYQLYYCLGFINMEIKDDRILAIENFNKFLKSCGESEYIQEKNLAENWIRELSVKNFIN